MKNENKRKGGPLEGSLFFWKNFGESSLKILWKNHKNSCESSTSLWRNERGEGRGDLQNHITWWPSPPRAPGAIGYLGAATGWARSPCGLRNMCVGEGSFGLRWNQREDQTRHRIKCQPRQILDVRIIEFSLKLGSEIRSLHIPLLESRPWPLKQIRGIEPLKPWSRGYNTRMNAAGYSQEIHMLNAPETEDERVETEHTNRGRS
ncbi:hypothetical protein VNO77_05026 [Canavalia gladiata]|uniref:Uncharacterized protein n=1 Tax=Canavalia gladiata TaxID=3824 RepID=A0AAN9R898_CANGL